MLKILSYSVWINDLLMAAGLARLYTGGTSFSFHHHHHVHISYLTSFTISVWIFFLIYLNVNFCFHLLARQLNYHISGIIICLQQKKVWLATSKKTKLYWMGLVCTVIGRVSLTKIKHLKCIWIAFEIHLKCIWDYSKSLNAFEMHFRIFGKNQKHVNAFQMHLRNLYFPAKFKCISNAYENVFIENLDGVNAFEMHLSLTLAAWKFKCIWNAFELW